METFSLDYGLAGVSSDCTIASDPSRGVHKVTIRSDNDRSLSTKLYMRHECGWQHSHNVSNPQAPHRQHIGICDSNRLQDSTPAAGLRLHQDDSSVNSISIRRPAASPALQITVVRSDRKCVESSIVSTRT